MCFQVLGFDIMIDNKCKPWLLEVNQSPSFSTDSPLDYKIKKAVLSDTFNLLNVSADARALSEQMQKEAMERRIRTGKTTKVTVEGREKLKSQKIQERSRFEKSRTGGYELIFPNQENDMVNKKYEQFLLKANELWDDFTTGGKNKKEAVKPGKNYQIQPAFIRKPTIVAAGNQKKEVANASQFQQKHVPHKVAEVNITTKPHDKHIETIGHDEYDARSTNVSHSTR